MRHNARRHAPYAASSHAAFFMPGKRVQPASAIRNDASACAADSDVKNRRSHAGPAAQASATLHSEFFG